MERLHREMVFQEERRSEYLWCLHCYRTYKRGQFRKVGDLQMCPYEGCSGDTVIDAWDWEDFRDSDPHLPEVPVPGATYPLYPEEGGRMNEVESSTSAK